MAPFVGESLTREELKALCDKAYGRFAQDAVTPHVQLDHRQWLLELFHGPTLAFKDVALQLRGLLFERFLTGKEIGRAHVGTQGHNAHRVCRLLLGKKKR